MRKQRRDRAFLRAAFVLGLGLVSGGHAEDADPAVEEAPDNDTFIAGDDVSTQGEIHGASVLAGGRIESGAVVHGDAVFIGGNIRVTGETKENLFALGGDVVIEGRVGGDARIAGGQVTIAPGAEIADDVTIAAGHIRIDGRVTGDARLSGGHIRLNGPVGGNVRIRAGQLDIGPNARIAGRVRFETKDAPHIDSTAEIKGGMQADSLPWYDDWVGSHAGGGGPTWFTLFVLGSIMILASPALGERLLAHLRMRSGATIGWGLLCFIATPIALVLCAVTIVGLPLALILLLGFLLLLLLGSASGALAIGQWGLARVAPARAASVGWQILALLTALIAVALVRQLPVLGGLVSFAVMVSGIGVLLMEVSRRLHSSNRSSSA